LRGEQPGRINLTLRMAKTLRFWVKCEYADRHEEAPDKSGSEIISEILREFEEAGDAMRYLNADGRVAWKATPRMLTRLADAEQEARDDLADWP
jgi:hypothetical protein